LNKNSQYYAITDKNGVINFNDLKSIEDKDQNSFLSQAIKAEKEVEKVGKGIYETFVTFEETAKKVGQVFVAEALNMTKFSSGESLKVMESEIFLELPRDEFEPKEWFSNSSYNLYTEQFLTGLDLNGTFVNAGNCIGYTLGFVDDTIQFENNFTAEVQYTELDELRPFYPILNFTGMIGTDFSEIPLACFELWVEVYAYWTNIYLQMNNDISIFIQAFLFT